MELASSSSSSSSSFIKSEPHFIYDAFINFGGEDIGRKFVSHLHSALLQAQVKTFISEESLPKGLKLEEHMRAIGHTKIAIIVFSKTYTESACCLLELEKIIECLETFGQIVFPVFYENDFGEALEKTAHKSYSGEQLEQALSRWRCALNNAARIRGWHAEDFRHDAELVAVTVRRVQSLLDYEDLSVIPFPVELESHVKKVIGCIENHSTKVCMIGIWGMAGSGKTTRAIYNRIYRLFIGKNFFENIKGVWDPVDRRYVDLKEFVNDVLNDKFKFESTWVGRTFMENELSRRKLLIVFDDVTVFDQLGTRYRNRKCFGQGTVIIITTRDVRILKRLKVDYVYKMIPFNFSVLMPSDKQNQEKN